MFCTRCGSENQDHSRFCLKCGHTFLAGTSQLAAGSPAPSEVSSGAIWNPNATANWSIIFTPAFGSYLQMLNWQSLGKPERAASAQTWFYISLAMLAAYVLLGVFMPDPKVSDAAARGLALLYLLVWYFGAGRSQIKFVKANLRSDYPRKPWAKPLLIAVAALFGYAVAAVIVGFLTGASGRS